MGYLNPVDPPRHVAGQPTRIQRGRVVTINPDGTVDLKPDDSRAGKIGVPVISNYQPTIGDIVYYADLNGDPQRPVIVEIQAASASEYQPQIDEIDGRVDTLDGRVDVLEARRVYQTGGWGASTPLVANTWKTIPLHVDDAINAPAGAFTRNSDGSLTVSQAGYYRFDFAVVLTGIAGGHHVTVGPNHNAQNFTAEAAIANQAGQFPILAGGTADLLAAGERLYVTALTTAASAANMRVFAVHQV